jgi:hypothetical protein
MGVIFGFEEEGAVVLMRDYMSDEPVLRLPIARLGPFICFLGRRESPLTPPSALLTGIQIGVENWQRGSVAGDRGRYWHGRAALLKWREDLLRVDELDATARKLLFFVNWWVFGGLADARAAAHRFLRRNSRHLFGRGLHHLEEAATLFADEARLLRSTLTDKQAFLGPWSNRDYEDWTAATRQQEAAILQRILAMDSDAMGELENVLAAAEFPLRPAEAVAVP